LPVHTAIFYLTSYWRTLQWLIYSTSSSITRRRPLQSLPGESPIPPIIRNADHNTNSATLGYAITWIMSQRILIHLQDYKTGGRSLSHSRSRTGSIRDNNNNNNTPSAATARIGPLKTPGMGSHFASSAFFGRTQGEVEEVELGAVHVTVDERVKVDYDAPSPVLRSPEKDEEARSVDSKSTSMTPQKSRIAWD